MLRRRNLHPKKTKRSPEPVRSLEWILRLLPCVSDRIAEGRKVIEDSDEDEVVEYVHIVAVLLTAVA